MAEEGYLLSVSDRDKLRKLLQSHSGDVTPSGPGSLSGSPDVYIAKVHQEEGEDDITIPALETAEGEYDHPGCAVCDFFKIMEEDGVWNLIPISGLARPVYNLTTSVIGKDEWFLAVKNKAGQWVAARGGGGSSSATYYRLITDIDEDVYMAFANPLIWDSQTFQWIPDPDHLDEAGEPIIDPEWSVVAVDTTHSIGAWGGDAITVVELAEKIETTYPGEETAAEFSMVSITARLNGQTTYPALVAAEDTMSQGGTFTAPVTIMVNGRGILRILHDFGLLSAGQTLVSPIDTGMIVEATYLPSLFMWYCTGAPCENTEMLT